MVLRKSKDLQIFGITYVDHVTRSVFNGSSLGKEFSAKGILESCKLNNARHEKHYQKSVSIYSENTQNLRSEDYLKTNPIDILLRTENTNDYIPKELKQKKKRRLRRGI